MSEVLPSILIFLDVEFRPIILTVATLLGLYFSFKKLGTSVEVQYSTIIDTFYPERIRSIVLTNHKDKVVPIWGIQAVLENSHKISLAEYSEPKLLKPYETMKLDFEKYSDLLVGSDSFEPNFVFGKVDLFLDNGKKFKKCKTSSKTKRELPFQKVSVSKTKFDDIVITKYMAFIFVYVIDGVTKTALIGKSGFITNEWGFSFNSFGENVSEKTIIEGIESRGLHQLFTNYICYKVEYPHIDYAFRMLPDKTCSLNEI